MKGLRNELKGIIKYLTNEERKAVQYVLKNEEDKHLRDYSILTIPFRNDLEHVNKSIVKEFYDIEDDSLINKVDIAIVSIILTLEKHLKQDIKEGFENSIVLDNEQPEFKYLCDKTIEYLESK